MQSNKEWDLKEQNVYQWAAGADHEENESIVKQQKRQEQCAMREDGWKLNGSLAQSIAYIAKEMEPAIQEMSILVRAIAQW